MAVKGKMLFCRFKSFEFIDWNSDHKVMVRGIGYTKFVLLKAHKAHLGVLLSCGYLGWQGSRLMAFKIYLRRGTIFPSTSDSG